MNEPTKKTTIIVLKKTLYQESSIIISSISPDYGKLDFLLRGEKRITKKRFPSVDLFRELNIEYKEKNSRLYTPIEMELINTYDQIAYNPKFFTEICQVSLFILKNTETNIQYNNLYRTLKNILHSSTENNPFTYPETVIKFIYLYENGLLPYELVHTEPESPDKRQKLIKSILDYSLGKKQNLPVLNKNYWQKFSSWVDELCKYHQIKL
jgi:recombinational DNA repair protein (RecF pathway)